MPTTARMPTTKQAATIQNALLPVDDRGVAPGNGGWYPYDGGPTGGGGGTVPEGGGG